MHSKQSKNWVSNGGHFTRSMNSILVTNATAQHEPKFANLRNTYKRNTTKKLNRAASFPLYLYAPMNSRYHDALKSFIKHLHLCGLFHYYHFSPVQSPIHLYQLSPEPEVTQHHKSSLHMLSGPHAVLPTGELSRTLIDMKRSPPLMLFSNFP